MSTLEVVPLTGRIGAEIRGVRLGPDLNGAVAAEIHAAWLKYKVVFFRDQDHLDDHAQEGLAWIFGGEAVAHPTVPAADGTEFVYEVDSELGPASYWHTDLTWSDTLPRGSILRAVVIPTVRRRHAVGEHGHGVLRPAATAARNRRPLLSPSTRTDPAGRSHREPSTTTTGSGRSGSRSSRRCSRRVIRWFMSTRRAESCACCSAGS